MTLALENAPVKMADPETIERDFRAPGCFFFGIWQAVSRLDISNKSKKLKLGVLPHPSKVGTTKGRSRNLQTSLT